MTHAKGGRASEVVRPEVWLVRGEGGRIDVAQETLPTAVSDFDACLARLGRGLFLKAGVVALPISMGVITDAHSR
jgi:hypothetical protein